jgi:hypothetical protein
MIPSIVSQVPEAATQTSECPSREITPTAFPLDGYRHFAKSKARDFGCGFRLLLLASLGVEQPRILDRHGRLTRDQHDEIEIVGVVCIGLV